jgi:quinoprotein dehydrogenase-associated probable ABC transporter substrate-binding protein
LLVVVIAGAALDYHVINTHHLLASQPRGVAGQPSASGPAVGTAAGTATTPAGAGPAAGTGETSGPATAVPAPVINARSMVQMMEPAPAAEVVQAAEARATAAHELRVCADPNNLPFSNSRGEGFENALARLVAADLGWTVRYTWWPQRRGFIRRTLRAGSCDVVMGVPASFDLAQPTSPYYRSSYVFVTRHDRRLRIRSFDDPRLHKLRIGIHAVGNDYGNVPPAQALAVRGIVDNVRGYTIYGAYSQPDPPKNLIDAVAKGEVDVAVAWGPLAGYFATREPVKLDVTPVSQHDTGKLTGTRTQATGTQAIGTATKDIGSQPAQSTPAAPALPMAFDISMAVRRGDDTMRKTLDDVLVRRRRDITRLLHTYGVPLSGIEHVETAHVAPPAHQE